MLKQLNCFVIAVLVCIQGNAQNCTLFRTNLIENSISKAVSLEMAQQVAKRFTLGIGIALPLNDNRYLSMVKRYDASKNEGYAYMYKVSGLLYKIDIRFNVFSSKSYEGNVYFFYDAQGGNVMGQSVGFDKDWLGNVRINTPFPDESINGMNINLIEQCLGVGGSMAIFNNLFLSSKLGLGYYTLFDRWWALYNYDNLEGRKNFSQYFSFGLEYVLANLPIKNL